MYIACNDLSYQYPGTDRYVFEKLNCRISGPGFHALFGPSGVGKTTLAKMLAGEIVSPSPEMITRKTKKTLFSYNLERLPGWHTVEAHLSRVTPASRKARRNDLVALFGIGQCLPSRFSRLSLGQQNRVNLIRYLLQDFDVLIMDESLANVDEATREQIILEIKRLYPDQCFLYISHNVQEVSKLCKHIWVLREAWRSPRMVSVEGRDYRRGEVDRQTLETTMLEVVHAS